MNNQVRALIAIAAVTFGAAGCTTATPATARPSPHGRTSPPGVLMSACTPNQLDAALQGSSEPGTGGTGLAVVYLWDTSAAACNLAGPVTITGLNRAGG